MKLEYLFLGWVFGAILFSYLIVTGRFDVDNFPGQPARATSDAEIVELYQRGQEDYARELYESRAVLGYSTEREIESILYPERVVEGRIDYYLGLSEKYPGSRDIYLQLALLYKSKGSELSAIKYLDMAKELDPNGDSVRKVQEIVYR